MRSGATCVNQGALESQLGFPERTSCQAELKLDFLGATGKEFKENLLIEAKPSVFTGSTQEVQHCPESLLLYSMFGLKTCAVVKLLHSVCESLLH